MFKMSWINKVFFVYCLLVPITALSTDWIILSRDDQEQVFISTTALDKIGSRDLRLQIKYIYATQRDLMGLAYNISTDEFLFSCETNLVLAKQKFLFNDEELVWTFPKTINKEKISAKIPDKLLREACQ